MHRLRKAIAFLNKVSRMKSRSSLRLRFTLSPIKKKTNPKNKNGAPHKASIPLKIKNKTNRSKLNSQFINLILIIME